MKSLVCALWVVTGAVLAAPQQGKPPPPEDYQRYFYGKVEGQKTGRIEFGYDFEKEVQLLDWEVVGEEAEISKGRLNLEKDVLLIHRFPFSGDMEVEIASKRMRSLSVELAGNGESEGTGYLFRLEPGKAARLVVTRGGDSWLEREIESGTVNEVTLSVTKGTIVLEVDNEEIFKKEDASPLLGTRVMVGGGSKDLAVERMIVRGSFDPAAVAAASLKKPLPKETWIPLIDKSGLLDFQTGRGGWTAEDGAIVFRGDREKDGWALRKGIDPSDLTDYILELEIRTDARIWTRRNQKGRVFFVFALGEKTPRWDFRNIASQVRGVDSSRSQLSLAKGRWHKVRVVVKGGMAEGTIDGKRAWTLKESDPIAQEEGKRRPEGFVFGAGQGPTSFRKIRLKITD